MRIKCSKQSRSHRVYAADDDLASKFAALDDEALDDAETDDIYDELDELSDKVDEAQDELDSGVVEDDVAIEINNNIVNHYIAECDTCKGIFISAMLESDQEVDKISGVCPLCDKETEQFLRWVIKDKDESSEEGELNG